MTPGTPTSFRLPALAHEQLNAMSDLLGMTRIQVMIIAIDRMAREELKGTKHDSVVSSQGYPPILLLEKALPMLRNLAEGEHKITMATLAEALNERMEHVSEVLAALRQWDLVTWSGPEARLFPSTEIQCLFVKRGE